MEGKAPIPSGLWNPNQIGYLSNADFHYGVLQIAQEFVQWHQIFGPKILVGVFGKFKENTLDCLEKALSTKKPWRVRV